MNDKHKEQLSAFIDNEIGPDELKNLDASDPALQRYQMMGDAIRGELSDASLVDISAQVKQAIENEPAHSVSKRNVTQQSSNSQPWFDLSAWMRPLGGMAVAASVALVMVVMVSQPDSDGVGPNNLGGQLANIESQPVMGLPVNNLSGSISDRIKANKAKNSAIDGAKTDEELEELKKRQQSTYLKERINQ